MKKVLLVASLLVMLVSCGKGSNGSETSTNKFIYSFIDSVEKAYPNRVGNDAVCRKIIDDFGERIKGVPAEKLFDGIEFYVFGLRTSTVGNEFIAVFSLSPENSGLHLSVNCDDIDEDFALKMDKTKIYRITGGTVQGTSSEAIMSEFEDVNLGDVIVSKIQVEEVPGKIHEPTGVEM